MARTTGLDRLVINDQLKKTGSYDNSTSNLISDNIVGAIDELTAFVTEQLVGGVTYKGSYDAVNPDPILQTTQTIHPGTVQTNSGSFTLIGSGFTNLEAGDKIRLSQGGNFRYPTIVSIESDTSLTLDSDEFQYTSAAMVILGATKNIESGDMYIVSRAGKFFNIDVSEGDSLISVADYPVAKKDWTIIEGNIENARDVDYSNTSSGLLSTNVQLALDEVASHAGIQSVEIEERNLFANYTLQNTDKVYQLLVSNTAVTVELPTSPIKNLRYVIINDPDNTQIITVTGGNLNPLQLNPGEVFEVVRASTKWVLI